MAFFSKRNDKLRNGSLLNTSLDLALFSFAECPIGSPIERYRELEFMIGNKESYENAKLGFEFGVKAGKLNYVFVDLNIFNQLYHNGESVDLSGATIQQVNALMGKEIWKDEDEDEIILFYEFDEIEIQFEFPDKQKLEIITITNEGLLKDPQQRKFYGIDS